MRREVPACGSTGTDGAPLRIEDHGVIGDLRTVALVDLNGTIDFLCLPEFDSPSVFASLLDRERGGHFSLAPRGLDHRRRRHRYVPDSNVLLTRFLSERDGVAEITDFMPVCTEECRRDQRIVRHLRTVRGRIDYRMHCEPRFGYGRAGARIERNAAGVLFTPPEGGPALRLHTDVKLDLAEGAVRADFTLGEGESASFVLETVGTGEESPARREDWLRHTMEETVDFWREWLAVSRYRGRWREAVDRSALTLKLLTSARHGSMVAAPTFGLPECEGGGRNWDYRYTWIRDTAFAMSALVRLGFTEEAEAFLGWIEDRCREDAEADPPLAVLYGLDGSSDVGEEQELDLRGYHGSGPVRVGNRAASQLQLDAYGELLQAIDAFDAHCRPLHHELWTDVARVVDWVCRGWRQPDEGIWETRAGRREFLYSRVMCWVAIDRAMRISRRRSLPAPLDRWRHTRDTIYADVMQRFWDARRRTLVQYAGGDTVDGASLLLPLVGFLSPRDPRWLGTLHALEKRLISDSLVYRYDPGRFVDGVGGPEGTFMACTFWYAEALAVTGQLRWSREVFEKALGYANPLGLFGEQLSTAAEHRGNFPQALTHLSLITAACTLEHLLSSQVARHGREPDRG